MAILHQIFEVLKFIIYVPKSFRKASSSHTAVIADQKNVTVMQALLDFTPIILYVTVKHNHIKLVLDLACVYACAGSGICIRGGGEVDEIKI